MRVLPWFPKETAYELDCWVFCEKQLPFSKIQSWNVHLRSESIYTTEYDSFHQEDQCLIEVGEAKNGKVWSLVNI